jgi:hypothetical protein
VAVTVITTNGVASVDGENEDQNRARADTGDGVGQIDPDECRERVGAKGTGWPDITGRYGLHHAVERQHHEWQQNVGHGDDRTGLVVNQRQAVFIGH